MNNSNNIIEDRIIDSEKSTNIVQDLNHVRVYVNNNPYLYLGFFDKKIDTNKDPKAYDALALVITQTLNLFSKYFYEETGKLFHKHSIYEKDQRYLIDKYFIVAPVKKKISFIERIKSLNLKKIFTTVTYESHVYIDENNILDFFRELRTAIINVYLDNNANTIFNSKD